MLEEIKLALNIEGDTKDNLLNSLIYRCVQRVVNYIKEEEVPVELEYVVVELVIARFNRLGSEGMKSESTDGVSFTYENDLSESLIKDLDKWIENNKVQSKSTVRMRLI